MKRSEIIINALTAQIEDIQETTAERIAGLESAHARVCRLAVAAESKLQITAGALGLFQGFFNELRPDLIIELANHVMDESENESAFNQDDRYEYGQKALQAILDHSERESTEYANIENTKYVLKEYIDKLSLLQSDLTLNLLDKSE